VYFEDLNGDGPITSESAAADLFPVEVLQRAYYYPFGLPMRSLWDFSAGPTTPWPTQTTPTQRYLYNGKELHEQLGLGWYDYGVRWYDAAVARWGQVDPLGEEMSAWSPYNYTFDNPIFYTDPTGLCPDCPDPADYNEGDIVNPNGGMDFMLSSGEWVGLDGNLAEVTVLAKKEKNSGFLSSSSGSENTTQMNIGLSIDWNRGVGMGESLIPVWGSIRLAAKDFNDGNYGWAAFNEVMAITDIFLVKSIVVGVGRLATKTAWKSGSNTWGATRSWMGRKGMAEPGQEVHHWLIHRNGPIGRNIPDKIKNQPWNLKNMPSDPKKIKFMKISVEDLRFPLLWINRDEKSMGVYRNEKDLITCGRGSEDFYNNLVLISFDGKKYTVLKAVRIGKAGGISGIAFLKYFGIYEIIVDLDFSDKVESCDLKTLKETISYILKEDEDYWDSDGNLDQLLSLLDKTTSVSEVVDLMKRRYFKEPLI